jgi:hypothetical protein
LRLAWLALGAFFAGLTGRVLLWEVHSFSELQAEHYLTIGAIVGAIAAGVFFGPMLRAGKLLSALGLGLAFTAATSYCLIGSAGRGDEAAFERNAKARQVNEERERLQRDLAESKLRYQAAVDAETAECSGGAGPKCIAKRQTTAQRRLDLEADTIRANEMKAEARENGKLKRAAELVSFFGRVEIATAERGLALLWPFVPPLVAELLTIVFLHHAFAFRGPPRRRRERPESGTIADSPTPGPGTVQVPQSQPSRETVGVVVPFRRPTKPTATTEATVLAYVAERLEAGETLPSQATIARRFQLPKQTVSRWMGRWEAAGLLSRTRDGRRNVISAS